MSWWLRASRAGWLEQCLGRFRPLSGRPEGLYRVGRGCAAEVRSKPMRTPRRNAASLLAVLAASYLNLAPVLAGVQAGGPIPRAADGKPDFSGMWDNPKPPGTRGGGATVFDKARMAPFKPGGEALFYE